MFRRASLLSAALVLTPSLAAAQSPAARPTPAFTHETWTVEKGLPVNSINALLQSRDGYIWVATSDGLARFDGVRFTVFNTANSAGLPSNRILMMREARDGSLWLQTEQFHLVRFRDGSFTHLDAQYGLSHQARAIYEDTAGHIWIGTSEGLGYINGDRFAAVPAAARISIGGILERRDGSLWLAGTPRGLYRFAGDRLTKIGAAGIDSAEITALYEDPPATLWIATQRGVWIERNGLQRVNTTGALGTITQFKSIPGSGHVIAYATTGVFRLRADGAMTLIDAHKPVLPSSLLVWADKDANLWHANGPRIYRNGQLVHALGDVAPNRVPPTSITAARFDREGSLWLGTRGAGLHRLKVDPAQLESNRAPPPVVIERVSAGDSIIIVAGDLVRLGTDARDLQIDYTALSFLEPANIRFRYRLEPYDRDWVDAGNRRTAFYTRVPPGRYRFHVIASSNEGIWNEQGAVLWLTLAPRLWQTNAFRASLLLLVALIGVAALRWRKVVRAEGAPPGYRRRSA